MFYVKPKRKKRHEKGLEKLVQQKSLPEDFPLKEIWESEVSSGDNTYGTPYLFKPISLVQPQKDPKTAKPLSELGFEYTCVRKYTTTSGRVYSTHYYRKVKKRSAKEIEADQNNKSPTRLVKPRWHQVPAHPNSVFLPIDSSKIYQAMAKTNFFLKHYQDMRFTISSRRDACIDGNTGPRWSNVSVQTFQKAVVNVPDLQAWAFFTKWAIKVPEAKDSAEELYDSFTGYHNDYPTMVPNNHEYYVVDIDDHPTYKQPTDIVEDFENRSVPMPIIIAQTGPCNFHLLFWFPKREGVLGTHQNRVFFCSKIAGMVKFPKTDKEAEQELIKRGIDYRHLSNGYFQPKIRMAGITKRKENKDPYLVHWFFTGSLNKNNHLGEEVYLGWDSFYHNLDNMVLNPARPAKLLYPRANIDNPDLTPDERDRLAAKVAQRHLDNIHMLMEEAKTADAERYEEIVQHIENSQTIIKERIEQEIEAKAKKQRQKRTLQKEKKENKWKTYIGPIAKSIRNAGLFQTKNAHIIASHLTQHLGFLFRKNCFLHQSFMAKETGLEQPYCSLALKKLVQSGYLVVIKETKIVIDSAGLCRKTPKVYGIGPRLQKVIDQVDERLSKEKPKEFVKKQKENYDVEAPYQDGKANEHIMADARHFIKHLEMSPLEAATKIIKKQEVRPRHKRRSYREIMRMCEKYLFFLKEYRKDRPFLCPSG